VLALAALLAAAGACGLAVRGVLEWLWVQQRLEASRVAAQGAGGEPGKGLANLFAPLRRVAGSALRRALAVARLLLPRLFAAWDARRSARHAERCARDLPGMIDILTLGLQAGLSFDAALDAYLERFDTPLATELELAQRSYQLGMCSRRQAFQQLCERIPDDAVMRFVAVVGEALTLGAPLLATFGTLTFELRRYQKLKLEERIARAPVKLLVPLGLCVLPAVLILLMGPVLIQMIAGLRL